MKSLLSIVIVFATMSASAKIQVSLTDLGKSARYVSRQADGLPCTRGVVSSVSLVYPPTSKAEHNRVAVMEVSHLSGLRERNQILARIVFSGTDMGTGLAMSHLVYRNSGISGSIEVCQNGVFYIGMRP